MKKKFTLSTLLLLFLICTQFPAISQLSGTWYNQVGDKYLMRQVGNELFWMMDDRPRVVNVFHGYISGTTITGVWCDMPEGNIQGTGTIAINIDNNNRLTKLSSTIPYLSTVWTRGTATQQPPATPPVTPPPLTPPPVTTPPVTGPISLPTPPTPQANPNELIIEAVDLWITATDIWAAAGNAGVYRIPLSTRRAVSYSGAIDARTIAVDGQNRPWILDQNNDVYYHDGSNWVAAGGKGKDLCTDKNGNLWTVDYAWWIKYWDASGRQWVNIEKPDGARLAIIDRNKYYRTTAYSDPYVNSNGTWSKTGTMKMKDIAISPQGQLWGIASHDNLVYKYNNSWKRDASFKEADRIAISPSGEAYTIKLNK